jgi:hypothetical protein
MKAGTSQYGVLTIGSPRVYAFFDLSAGTTGFVTSGATSSITAIGGGWYRCSVTIDYCSYVEIYQSDTNTSITGTTGNIYIWKGQVEAGVMTDYIGDTTTTAVSVGPVSGLPRLDYLNSSCPRLLLEPQRTNIALWSENFNNATWTKTEVTVTANQAVSPDGYNNADLLADNTALAGHVTQQTFFSASSQLVTISGYFKDKDIRYAGFRLFVPDAGAGVGRFSIVVDLQTGAITSTLVSGATIANLSYDVTSVGNGWYRARITGTCPIGTASIMAWLSPSATPTNDGFATTSYVGTGKGCYLYGFQAEFGAYATSYIPTLGTSATRVADAASKTGISSLIGQTEGTLFAEFNARSLSETRRVFYTYQDGNNFIMLTLQSTNDLRFLVFAGGAIQANFTTPIVNGNVKMAGAYKANDFVLYVNGVQIGTDTSGTVPATSSVYVGYDVGGTLQLADGIKQALLFKTRLTNDALASLTTL